MFRQSEREQIDVLLDVIEFIGRGDDRDVLL
eukprot:COSAG01_NODE_62449_length_284_cov_1.378378_1_plen_30_part_10